MNFVESDLVLSSRLKVLRFFECKFYYSKNEGVCFRTIFENKGGRVCFGEFAFRIRRTLIWETFKREDKTKSHSSKISILVCEINPYQHTEAHTRKKTHIESMLWFDSVGNGVFQNKNWPNSKKYFLCAKCPAFVVNKRRCSVVTINSTTNSIGNNLMLISKEKSAENGKKQTVFVCVCLKYV